MFWANAQWWWILEWIPLMKQPPFPMDGNGICAVPLSLFLLAKIPCPYDSQYTPINRVFNDLLAKIPCPYLRFHLWFLLSYNIPCTVDYRLYIWDELILLSWVINLLPLAYGASCINFSEVHIVWVNWFLPFFLFNYWIAKVFCFVTLKMDYVWSMEGRRVPVLDQEELQLLHRLFIHGWLVQIQNLQQEDKKKGGVKAIPCPCRLVLRVVHLPCLMGELGCLPKTHTILCQNGEKEGSSGGELLGMFILDLTGKF